MSHTSFIALSFIWLLLDYFDSGSCVNCSVLSGWRYALVSAPLVWVSFSFSTLVSVHSFGCLSFLSGVAFLLLRFTM